MKKFSDSITIAAFFTIIIMFAVSTLFFQKNSTLSQQLEQSGSVSEAVSEYTHSNFPLLDNWKSLYANIMVITGRELFDDVFLAQDKLIKLSGESDDEQIAENIKTVNAFALLNEKPVYVMLAPTAAGIYSAALPDGISQQNQKEQIDKIYLELDKSVGTIDAYYPLYSARDEYVYYRTENLWTSFGAYYAYTEAIKQLGFQPQTMQNYDQEYALSSFTGSLYEKAMYSGISPDRINLFRSKYQSTVESVVLTNGKDVRTASSVYFRSALKTDSPTDVYLLGDSSEKVSIYTNVEDAPSLLIIKGSFANTLVPFLTPHYSEITLIDPSLIKQNGSSLSELVDVTQYDQILFMFDTQSFVSADYLDVLLEQST